MKRVLLGGLLLLVFGSLGVFYWLFYDNTAPSEGEFPLDLAALRAEANAIPGPGPSDIEVETIYRSIIPRISMVTGSDWSDMAMVRNSYRLVYSDASVILDTGLGEAEATEGDAWLDTYHPDAWERTQDALLNASAILVTHEHCDHIGGLLSSPHWRQLLPKAILSTAQFDNVPECTVWPEGSREGFTPLAFDDIRGVAPGVVLIRAPGHTRGSQMIYVRREDGHEFLFTGDTATALDNVRLVRPRSRYVMITGGHEDVREDVFLETIAVHRLTEEAPELTIVPGHDEAALLDLERAGLLKRGFSLPD